MNTLDNWRVADQPPRTLPQNRTLRGGTDTRLPDGVLPDLVASPPLLTYSQAASRLRGVPGSYSHPNRYVVVDAMPRAPVCGVLRNRPRALSVRRAQIVAAIAVRAAGAHPELVRLLRDLRQRSIRRDRQRGAAWDARCTALRVAFRASGHDYACLALCAIRLAWDAELYQDTSHAWRAAYRGLDLIGAGDAAYLRERWCHVG